MSKRTVDEYLSLPYTIEVIRDEEDGGWVARVVELPGCLTQGDTFEELGEMIEDAMRGWITVALEDGQVIPEPRPAESYSGKFIVRVPKSLHRELAETADREGVSLNMYVSTGLGKAVGQAVEGRLESAREKEVNPLPVVNWQRLSGAARRLMVANGLAVEAQEIEETLFASWVDEHLDQARMALGMADYRAALQYVRALRHSLEQLCGNSPLVRTYCQAVALLDEQVTLTFNMVSGILEQPLIQKRVLAQVRDKNIRYEYRQSNQDLLSEEIDDSSLQSSSYNNPLQDDNPDR